MGRHNKSNGRLSDPTYDYDRWNPMLGPRPAYGRATKTPKMGHEEFKDLVKKDPSFFPCGVVRGRTIMGPDGPVEMI